jgi:hypothetical protein
MNNDYTTPFPFPFHSPRHNSIKKKNVKLNYGETLEKFPFFVVKVKKKEEDER